MDKTKPMNLRNCKRLLIRREGKTITTYCTDKQRDEIVGYLEELRNLAYSRMFQPSPEVKRIINHEKNRLGGIVIDGKTTRNSIYKLNKDFLKSKLSERQLLIVGLKEYGLTYDRIGEMIFLSRQRIEQIYRKALLKLTTK